MLISRSGLTGLAKRMATFVFGLSFLWVTLGVDLHQARQQNPLHLPQTGDHGLLVLTPAVLELTAILPKEPEPAPMEEWNFVDAKYNLTLPGARDLQVLVNGKQSEIKRIGFKRRPLYAPLRKRDLRVGCFLYLELSAPVPEGARVEVKNPTGKLWPKDLEFTARADSMRWSPVIHVNQHGYAPSLPKSAMLGYYLGSLGELLIPALEGFQLVDARSGQEVYRGKLKARKDVGFSFPCYQQVVEADFSDFKTPGLYRLKAPGIGFSDPFYIDDGIAAGFARAYALGLYHQRCGTSNALPYTRFTHGPCHMAPADIPTKNFEATEKFLGQLASEGGGEREQTAPPLKSVAASLYPIGKQGKVDVSGGHHDAGDYSKYLINSAGLVHHLVFAADVFPGAGDLDNLGLPESGDGKSDLLQIARWEAEFICKMQDADGGFFFLVYPKNRKYEDDVLPDKSDPQVVFPKTTSVTAAAVAALAQAASSPLFQKQFPAESKRYLQQAKLGWKFLQAADAKHGRKGAYQKITHYGHEFLDDDERAWAAVELFLATGDAAYVKNLAAEFDPESRDTKRWTWWRLYESYGNAIRSYAFAVQTGRRKPAELDAKFLAKCRAEVLAAAQDQARFTRESAYGTAFPDPSKRFRTAGWYFSSDRAFDLAVGYCLDQKQIVDPKPEFLAALVSNLNYEAGCNPVNVSYLTGFGLRQQRDIVHQYAQNDDRALPPSGLPLGNIQAGFQFLHHYQRELGALCYPPDGAETDPYPFYDRWGDSFNVTAEFVVVNQARALASASFLMALSPLKGQPADALPQRSAEPLRLEGEASLRAGAKASLKLKATDPKFDLANARVVWEAKGQEPQSRSGLDAVEFIFATRGKHWIEAEALWPDGRRAFLRREVSVP